MKKKLLSLAVALAMALTMLPTVALAAPSDNIADYTVTLKEVSMTSAPSEEGHATLSIEGTVTIAREAGDTENPEVEPTLPTDISTVVSVTLAITPPTSDSGTGTTPAATASFDEDTNDQFEGDHTFTASADVQVAGEYSLSASIALGAKADGSTDGSYKVTLPSDNPAKTDKATAVLGGTSNGIKVSLSVQVGPLSQQTGTQYITTPLTVTATAVNDGTAGDISALTAAAVKDAITAQVKFGEGENDTANITIVVPATAATAEGDGTSATFSFPDSYAEVPSRISSIPANTQLAFEFGIKGTATATYGITTVEGTGTLADGYTNPNPDTEESHGDTSKAINPTNVKYDPKTGKLEWTMKGITSANAHETANDHFFVGFMTTATGDNYVGNSVAAELQYNTHVGGRHPISINDKTNVFTGYVDQPATLKAGNKYYIYIENCNKTDGEMVTYRFTAVAVIVDIPSVNKNGTTEQLAEAVGQLQSWDKDSLAASVVNNTSSAKDYKNLDEAAKSIKGITVTANTDSAPSFIKSSKDSVQIVGAALNASGNATLTFSTTSTPNLPTNSKYDNSSAVKFSITTSNIASPTHLAVPIVVTVPRPDAMIAKNIVVLHYSDADDFTVIIPKVASKTITFATTGFSDFAITEDTSLNNTSSSGSKTSGSSSGGAAGGASVTPGTVIVAPPVTSTPSAPSTVGGFSDVLTSNTFATQISWAQSNGYMGGYSDGTFRPNNGTNRQQIWMVLGRMAGANPADMAAAREWAVSSGISDGANAEGGMSRQQMITMLYRFAQSQGLTISGSADLSGYPDNGVVANYAQEALAWGVANGIITGTTEGNLNPEGVATRAHFAAFLYRFDSLNLAPAPAETAAETSGEITEEDVEEIINEIVDTVGEIINEIADAIANETDET